MGVSEIYDGISNMLEDDGSMNYVQVHEITRDTNLIMSLIAGYLVTFIVAGLGLIIALEILYINFPIFQSSADKLIEKNKRTEKIIGLCLRDGRRAVYEANTAETGLSANIIYAKIKVKVIFLAFIIVGFALNFGTIINFLSNLITNVLGSLN